MERHFKLAERTIDEHDVEDLVSWLRTHPWLTQGPLVRDFEAAWASWLGVRRSVFVNSGSSANLIAYAALEYHGRTKNKTVVVPAVSWATTVAPAIQLGWKPLMCDADPVTFGLDLDQLDKLCAEHKPSLVVAVHVLGTPNDMDRMLELQKKHGFALMEDSCAAHGSTWRGKRVGSFGDISTFSFFFGHHISTIEGGMVCTNDEKLADMLIQVRAHGWGKDLPPEKESALAAAHGVSDFTRPFTFYVPGFNVRSSDLNARLGLSQMKKIDRVIAARVANHKQYQQRIGANPAFTVQRSEHGTISSISFSTLASSPAHREAVALKLRAANVEHRPLGGGNMSRQPFWAERYGKQVFPVADRIHETSIQMPNHPDLTSADVEFICDTVLSAEVKR